MPATRSILARRPWSLAVLLAGGACALAPSPPSVGNRAAGEITTILLVRHAEPLLHADADPPLCSAGNARAQTLIEVAAEAEVDAVYATQYKRARQTALPLTRYLGLPIHEFAIDPRDPMRYARALADQLRSGHSGEVVLVVSHRSTIPLMVWSLTGKMVPPIGRGEYDHLYVVVLEQHETPLLIHGRYGPPNPADSAPAMPPQREQPEDGGHGRTVSRLMSLSCDPSSDAGTDDPRPFSPSDGWSPMAAHVPTTTGQ